MDATQVVPKRWLLDEAYKPKVLFDDGEYSVIWGKYDGIKALGARWNGDGDNGYPSLFGNPMWFVEPDFIAIAIIHRLHTMALDIIAANIIAKKNNSPIDTNVKYYYLDEILFALTELQQKMTN